QPPVPPRAPRRPGRALPPRARGARYALWRRPRAPGGVLELARRPDRPRAGGGERRRRRPGRPPARRRFRRRPADAPIGRVLVAVSDAGVVRVGFRRSAASFAAGLTQQLDAEVVRSPVRTADVVRQLRAYFAGERRAFELPVDLARVTDFQRRVLTATAAVPAGRLVSYGDIARRIGRP